MRGAQEVPGHPKTAGRKHFFTVAVVGKGSRLADQRIDDVPIIDRGQMLTNQSRHDLNDVTVVRHRDLFGTDPQINQLTDQSAGNRVGVGSHADRAAARDPHTFDDVVGIETLLRQSVQMCQVLEKHFSSVIISPFDQFFDEGDILFTTLKMATAPQQQCLFNAILEMAVGRFDIAVFVGTPRVGAFGLAVVITHQGCIPLGEFATAGVIPHSRRQRITAMSLGHAAEFPERLLNARAQRFEGF